MKKGFKNANSKKSLRIVLIFALTILFLMTSLPMTTFAETVNTAAEEEQAILAEIDAMLAKERILGEVVFYMKDGITLEQARDILGEYDIPNDFENRDVYIYCSGIGKTSVNGRLWFTIRIPESDIRETLRKLLMCEFVSSAEVNWSSAIDTTIEEIEEIDDLLEAEANLPAENYDADTTLWAMTCMGVNSAWKYGFNGSENIMIAVLDTGYSAHGDIQGVNTELAADINCPIDGQDQEYQSIVTDEDGHGTFIIGQIMASLNGYGVNGICRQVTVVPVKITYMVTINEETDEKESRVSCSLICAGLEYAEKIGAHIVNLSMGTPSSYRSNLLGANYNGLLVCSAGNDDALMTPNTASGAKANDKVNWIVVGNMTSSFERGASSNWSPIYVDLFAPGSSISGVAVGPLSNKDFYVNGLRYTSKSGTSMAAPQVAAAAALLMSHATHLDIEDVKQLLMDNVTVVDGFDNLCVSGGYLNISKAIASLYNEIRPAYSRGDINGDCKLDVIDYMMLKRAIIGTYNLDELKSLAADIDDDGVIGVLDYMMLKRYTLSTFYFSP